MAIITIDEYKLWLEDRTTKKVLAMLQDKKESIIESLAYGQTLYESSSNRTVIQTARAVGTIYGIEQMLNYQPEATDE